MRGCLQSEIRAGRGLADEELRGLSTRIEGVWQSAAGGGLIRVCVLLFARRPLHPSTSLLALLLVG